MFFKKSIDVITTYLLLPQCLVCQAHLKSKELSASPFLCFKCSQSLPWYNPKQALQTPTYLDHCYSTFFYHAQVRQWVLGLKFHQQERLIPMLSRLMYQTLPSLKTFDYITPIPLHKKRFRQRGFNQSLELVRTPIWNQQRIENLLIRTRYTQEQAKLSRKGRIENIQNAFAVQKHCEKHVKDCSILLIDDVMTSGETLNEAAKVLKMQGAKTVCSLTLARRVFKDSSD